MGLPPPFLWDQPLTPPPASGAPATQVELEVRAAAQEVLGHVQEAYIEDGGSPGYRVSCFSEWNDSANGCLRR